MNHDKKQTLIQRKWLFFSHHFFTRFCLFYKNQGSQGPGNPGKPGKVREFENGQGKPGKVREFRVWSGNFLMLSFFVFLSLVIDKGRIMWSDFFVIKNQVEISKFQVIIQTKAFFSVACLPLWVTKINGVMFINSLRISSFFSHLYK